MTVNLLRSFAGAVLATLTMTALQTAAADLTKQEPVTVTIKLGEKDGQHRFTPDSLTLEAGKLYALLLENAGTQPYYFGSSGLADAVYTRKVVAKDAAGKVVAEIYGPVRRIEISVGHTVEWWFLPVRTGRFDDVTSTKKLAEAGMRATIEVK
jgi:plastocyanin